MTPDKIPIHYVCTHEKAEACFGCGLCRTACPEDCIQMVERP